MTVKAYLELKQNDAPLGKLSLQLHDTITPRTVQNFLQLLTPPNEQPAQNKNHQHSYLNSSFHRLIPNFMIQGGDFTNHDGTGGISIYGKTFNDENFLMSHDERGVLSMANSGKDTNGSQFFITFRPCSHLDGKHVVFGRVDMEDRESRRILDCLEKLPVGKDDVPRLKITIAGGGVGNGSNHGGDGNDKESAIIEEKDLKAIQDDDEIDLDDDDDEEEDGKAQEEVEKKEESTETKPIANTKKAKLQERLRKLKMKMNQSRQLNKKEVMNEGERLGSKEVMIRHSKQVAKNDRAQKEKEWTQLNTKAMESAKDNQLYGKDGKYMVQSAAESIRQIQKEAEKEERNRFSVKDYYNSEGQMRNYERSLKSIDASSSMYTSAETYEEKNLEKIQRRERDGAKRLASELKRRAGKAEKRKQKDMEFESTDVSSISQRNKRFNEKINRNYDKHTAEIRQNLERGTAL